MKWGQVAAGCVLPAIFTLALGVGMSRGQDSASLNLMPLPAKAQRGDGALKIDANFQIAFAGHREPRLDRASQRFLGTLRRETGIVFLSANKAAANPTLLVTTDHESKPVQELGEDESYTLDVAPAGA